MKLNIKICVVYIIKTLVVYKIVKTIQTSSQKLNDFSLSLHIKHPIYFSNACYDKNQEICNFIYL